MLKTFMGKCSLIAVACSLSLSAYAVADARESLAVPAGDLVEALKELARQSDIQLIYQQDQLKDLKTEGLKGSYSPQEAVSILLRGTALRVYSAGSGAMVIAPTAPGKEDAEQIGKMSVKDRLRVAQADTGSRAGTSPEGVEPFRPRSSSLEEVIVTAQKREERSIDVPMSITAVSGQELNDKGVKNLQDLSYSVPGLNISELGPGNQAIIVRGIFSQRGTSSLTGLYLDELPLSGMQDGALPAYADVRPIDLDRVEVLKGPQGTLFGEGAAGGVVRFITKDPDLSAVGGELSAEFFDTADGGWSSGLSGVINVPLAEDVFGIRVAGTYDNKDGWIDQPAINRRDINDSETKHLRAKALLAPLSGLKITGLVEVHRDAGGGTNQVNLLPVDKSNFQQAGGPSFPTNYKNDYELYNLTASYDFGFAELLSSTSYTTFEGNRPITQLIDAEPNPWLEVWGLLILDSSNFSQEVRLTSSTSSPFQWTVGAAYKDSERVIPVGESPGAFASLLGGALVLTNFQAGQGTSAKSENWAGFVDASYEFLDRFEIGGGLRQFTDERSAASQLNPTAPVVSAGAADFEKLTYRVYAKYKPTENINIYGSLATGFRSGDVNDPALVARGASPSIAEENSKFYELGIKAAALNGRLQVNGALFYGEYTDMQEQFTTLSPVDGDLLTYNINGQDAEVRGIDGDITWAVTDRLTLSLAGSINDTQIVAIEPGVNSPYRVGDSINQVPDYNLSSTLDYRFEWSSSVPGSFLLTYSRQGEAHYFRRNGAPLQTPDRFVNSVPEKDFVNVNLGAEWNDWQVSIFARNLLDERVILFPTENSWGSQARPRTFGVTLRKTF